MFTEPSPYTSWVKNDPYLYLTVRNSVNFATISLKCHDGVTKGLPHILSKFEVVLLVKTVVNKEQTSLFKGNCVCVCVCVC